MPKTKTTKASRTFTVDKDVMKRVQAMSKAENRKLSNMIEVLLREAIATRDNQ